MPGWYDLIKQVGYTLNVIFVLHVDLNNWEHFFDGGDCCLNVTSSENCFKGLEFCIESEIGDGTCQDYNSGK